MDKIKKALKRLSAKERLKVKQLLTKLKNNETKGLDIKKLKDRHDIFRLRSGDLRIIYRVKNNQLNILSIERRSERTYKNM